MRARPEGKKRKKKKNAHICQSRSETYIPHPALTKAILLPSGSKMI